MINVKQIAKFVVGLGDRVAPADVEEGMRVGVDRNKYQIQIPLPPKIDPTVTMMTVEEKPDITYNDIGGNKVRITNSHPNPNPTPSPSPDPNPDPNPNPNPSPSPNPNPNAHKSGVVA